MKSVFAILSSFVLLYSCKKKDQVPQLPEATHYGANTLGCKINGELFSVSGKSYSANPNGVTLYPSSTAYWIIEGKAGTKVVYIQITVGLSPMLPGSFEVGDEFHDQASYFHYPEDNAVPTPNTEFATDSVHTGLVTVTDYTRTFAAGTFEFDAINGTGEVVHITEGRFDISF